MTDPCLLPAGTRIDVALHHSEVLPSLDFETYSEAGYVKVPNDPHGDLIINGRKRWVPPYSIKGKGLAEVGTAVYAAHPTTEVLSLVYDLKDGKGRRRWLPGFPTPVDLLQHVQACGLLEAWNATFEWFIWNMVCTRRYGWPPLPLHQCRCAMAKARRFSLPGSLDAAAKVLGTPEKDKDGKRLLTKLSRPHTPTKTRPAHRWTQATAWDDFCKLYDYNDGDVVAEDHASAHVPDLPPFELDVWLLDQTINARGVQVDTVTLEAALDILAQAEDKYTAELQRITGGAVQSVNEVAKFGDWLQAQGCGLPDLQAETVRDALAGGLCPLTGAARAALEIRAALGAANVKKLHSLRAQVSSDGRLRNQYKYCGADRTGRWAAQGVQLQNITANGPPAAQCSDMTCQRYFGHRDHTLGCPHCGSPYWDALPKGEWPIDAVASAIEDVRTRSLEHVERVWGGAIPVLCGILRGMLTAAPGKRLVCSDFSAIEAVAAACLARCQWRIDVFNTPGDCIYTQSASKITGTPIDVYKAYKAEHGTHHNDRKKIGKVAELASGFGGWINAWKAFGCDMDDDALKRQVLAWREASPEIVDMWGGEYKWCGPGKWDYRYELHGLEGCAMQAIMYPGQCFTHNDITYGVRDDILFCRLPSGRFLYYHRPRLVPTEDKLRRGPAHSITFEGYNTNSQKGPVGWYRMETFGGRLFENCIAEGELVLTRGGWVPIQCVCDSDEVHDGVDWVAHGGLVYKSKQSCMLVDGVWMTPDHEVLTDDGWQKAEEGPRPYRPDLRHVDGFKTSDEYGQKIKMGLRLQVRDGVRQGWRRCDERGEKGPHAQLRLHNPPFTIGSPRLARNEPTPRLRCLQVYARPLSAAVASSVGELWRAGRNRLRALAARLRVFLGGHGGGVWAECSARPQGQRRRVLAAELPLGAGESQREQQALERGDRHARGGHDRRAGFGDLRCGRDDAALPRAAQVADGPPVRSSGLSEPKRVYDIVNAGPRHRFVVLGANGPFIVHNCVQAVSRDIQAEAMLRCERAGYSIVMHTHDEVCAEVDDDPRYTVEAMEAIMAERPQWASWWPIRAAGWTHTRYQKD